VTNHRALLVGHRGASHAAPENTLPSFRLAFEEGADFIEGDFWLTRDEQIVCIHDADTRRVAPGQPIRRVTESTLAELRELDVGAWKDAKYAGSLTPSLEEVLALVPPDKGIYIEIKDGRPEIARHLKRVLDRSGLKPRQVVFIAFDPAIVQAVKAEMPHIKAHWLYWWSWDHKANKLSNAAGELLHVARATTANGIDINKCRWADGEFIRQARQAGLEFHVYTINELIDAARYVALGADSITTDRPAGLRKEIDSYFQRLEVAGDGTERLMVLPDGTWRYAPYGAKK
jgi:glycerophosphoryl diester phosphodiesterase